MSSEDEHVACLKLGAMIRNNFPGLASAARELDVESGRRAGIGKILELETNRLSDAAGVAQLSNTHNPPYTNDPTQKARLLKTRGSYWLKKSSQPGKEGNEAAVALASGGNQSRSGEAALPVGTEDKLMNRGVNHLVVVPPKNNSAPGLDLLGPSKPPRPLLMFQSVPFPSSFRSLANVNPGGHPARPHPVSVDTNQPNPIYIPAPIYNKSSSIARHMLEQILPRPQPSFQVCNAEYERLSQASASENKDRGSISSMEAELCDLPELDMSPVNGFQPSRSVELRMSLATLEDEKETNLMRVEKIPIQVSKEEILNVLKQWGDCELQECGETEMFGWMVVKYDLEQNLELAMEKGNRTEIGGSLLSCSYY